MNPHNYMIFVLKYSLYNVYYRRFILNIELCALTRKNKYLCKLITFLSLDYRLIDVLMYIILLIETYT